eukprot:1210685-Prorocentrum_lima.AAC.1
MFAATLSETSQFIAMAMSAKEWTEPGLRQSTSMPNPRSISASRTSHPGSMKSIWYGFGLSVKVEVPLLMAQKPAGEVPVP